MSAPADFDRDENGTLRFTGNLSLASLGDLPDRLDAETGEVSRIDLSGIDRIDTIGAWVVREACAQAARWPENIRVAVNASAVQFHRGALHETIVGALAESGIEPARLEVEIT